MIKFYLSLSRYLTVFLVCISSLGFAQQITVSGKVTSADDGSPVPGANVLEKGTTNGTVTDTNGEFKINVNPDATLSVSFVGYKTQEVAVGSQTIVNVVLVSDITSLSEVVVVGYGEREKKDVTGVVTAVDSKSFNKGAIVSPDQLIAGKIAGVQITPNSGEPGVGGTIRIRGGTSINAGNDPLFVIDGIPVDNTGFPGGRNPLNFINPNDIETFTVLKDASAAAIYGSRAANGVIIITTKKGKAGAPTITYDTYFSSSQVTRKLNVLNGDQYRELVNLVNPNVTAKLYDNDPTLKNRTSTDWQDQILQVGVGQSHNLSFSGGTDKMGLRGSIGYLDQNGIIKTSNTKRTSFSLNFNQKMLDDKLKIDANVKASETKDIYNGGGIGGAYSFAPTQPVYDTAKSPLYGGYWEWSNFLGTKNPVAQNNLTNSRGVAYRGMGNLQLDYNFSNYLPGLRANLNLGADVISSQRKFFQPTFLREQSGASFPGNVQLENVQRINKLLEFYLNYTRALPSISSKFDLTAGYSFQNFESFRSGFSGSGLSSNNYGYNNPSVSNTAKRDVYADPQENRLISFFGRLNFSHKDKYILTTSLRRDGSARFGGKNRWGLFPSAAVAWRVLDEDFASSFRDILSELKLRVGYGVNGNQEFGNYLYIPTYSPTNGFAEYPFGSTYVSPIRPSAVDPNLKWEQTQSSNIGLDFGVLSGRLTGSIEYYRKDTKDLLFVKNVPAGTVPGDRVLTNVGKIRNTGFELTLNAVAIDAKDLRWNVSFNAATNTNKVIALDGVDDPKFQGYETLPISGALGNFVGINKVGYAVNSFRLFDYINGPNGQPRTDQVDWNKDGIVDQKDMYRDVNGDGVVNDQDRVPHKGKSPSPKVFMGFTSTLNYKNIDFSFTLRSNLGGYVYNNVLSSTGYLNRINDIVPQNIPVAALKTNFQAPQFYSNYYLESSSFLRLDNVTIGYTVKKLKNVKARIYGTAQNLFVLTKYKGIDPEVVSINNGVAYPGVDNNLYPRSRTFILGLSVGF